MRKYTKILRRGIKIGKGVYQILKITNDNIILQRIENGIDIYIPIDVIEKLLTGIITKNITLEETGRLGRDKDNHVFDKLKINHDKYIMGYDSSIQKICEYCINFQNKSSGKVEISKLGIGFLTESENNNIQINNKTILNFTSALLSKPFTIFTGLSGSGKMQMI